MKRPVRHTQDIALEELYGSENAKGLIPTFTTLTFDDQATTAELQEAYELLPLITHVMRTWISSRHLIGCANTRVVTTRAELELALKEATNDAAMDEAMDLVPTRRLNGRGA